MNAIPPRRIELQAGDKPDADWTVRLAIGAAAGFTLLLTVFGFVLYSAWPQMSGVRQTVGALSAKTDRIADRQEALTRDIAALRTDLRDNRAGRVAPAPASADLSGVRGRIDELTTAVATLREQADKLQALEPPSPAARPAPARDPAIAELRSRIDALQRRIDHLSATQQGRPAHSPPAAAVPRASTTPPRSPFPVEEIDREVREMQEVIRLQRENGSRAASTHAPIRIAPAPAPASTRLAVGSSSIADPLAPMVSRTQPRIAPARPGMSSTALVSWAPSAPLAQQSSPPREPGAPEARVTRVGINSGEKALGPIAIPFDALGNLVVAIAEGLDTLFTGRTYLPRPVDEPAQARR